MKTIITLLTILLSSSVFAATAQHSTEQETPIKAKKTSEKPLSKNEPNTITPKLDTKNAVAINEKAPRIENSLEKKHTPESKLPIYHQYRKNNETIKINPNKAESVGEAPTTPA